VAVATNRGMGNMPRLAYLLSASHSGSTLMAMLLGAHPEACSVGELKGSSIADAENYRCSCKRLIRQCDFWAKISAAMAEEGFPNFEITQSGTNILAVKSRYARRLLAPLFRGGALELARDTALAFSPAWREHFTSTQKRNVALIRSIQSITRARVIIDSSKAALRLKYLLKIPELDIRVIRIIRDGRAVALTYTDEWTYADASDPALRGGGAGVRRPTARESMADAANEWKRSNEAGDLIRRLVPANHWTQVRYEDLCADPAGTLQRLSSFLEIDPGKIDLNFRSREQHVVGNGMRMDNTSEIRLDTRWQTALSKADLATFDAVAGSLNRSYGYQ
jgi:hypothetical protein